MVRWFDDEKDHPPFLKTLQEARRQATREGWCYQHVQARLINTRKRRRATEISF